MVDAKWLRSLGDDGLTRLLQRRPEALAAPAPESLTELAERLVSPYQMIMALRQLTLPELQVAEALAALGGRAGRERLASFLGDPPAATLTEVIHGLSELALLAPGHELALLPGLDQVWPRPLGLGPRAGDVHQFRTVAELREFAVNLGLRPPARKAELLSDLVTALSDADRVRRVVAGAPPEIRDELTRSAISGEPIELHWSDLGYYRPKNQPKTAGRWGVEHGFLVRHEDGVVLVAEVALALRGEGYRAPFDPAPPQVARTTVATQAVAGGGVAASSALGRCVVALLTAAGQEPIRELKSGGIGAREIKRLAKLTGHTEPEVRLALAISFEQELWVFTDAGITPTSQYDDWLRQPPAEQIASLLRAWWQMPELPLMAGGAWQPSDHGEVQAVRTDLIAELGNTAVVDIDQLAASLRWRRPMMFRDPERFAPTIRALVAEAELVGAVIAGAATPAGRALATGGDVAAALAGVGEHQHTVRFQADLTAVVAGVPAPELADFLNTVADAEQRGAASTWRFSAGTVRRALDAGADVTQLLDGLTELSGGDCLPQPLRYLIQDVARGHGAIRVRAVASCLRSDDTALLSRVAADRKLRDLALHLLAPTVLASGKPLEETLTRLRSAGYAPVAEGADGAAIAQSTVVHRVAVAAPAPSRTAPRPRPPSAAEAAGRLMRAPDRKTRRPGKTAATIARYAEQLSQSELRILAHAIEGQLPVAIAYTNRDGNSSTRVIDQIELEGGQLFAWCHLREDDRCFNLAQIETVIGLA